MHAGCCLGSAATGRWCACWLGFVFLSCKWEQTWGWIVGSRRWHCSNFQTGTSVCLCWQRRAFCQLRDSASGRATNLCFLCKANMWIQTYFKRPLPHIYTNTHTESYWKIPIKLCYAADKPCNTQAVSLVLCWDEMCHSCLLGWELASTVLPGSSLLEVHCSALMKLNYFDC